MVKKRPVKRQKAVEELENVTDKSLLEIVKENTISYGKETIEQRALPDYRDGLKPVHRRILWSMYKMGLKSNGPYKKAARVIGDVLGKYHPHGDQAAYQAMVTMANFSEPLVDGQGNWGTYDKEAAAYRYTEARLTKYAENYLLDPDYLAVIPYVGNYDGSEIEPVILPSKLPNLLLNGSEGIATGCSSLIPSFSFESVKELVIKALEGKKVNAKLCKDTLEFKFPYGGKTCSSDRELLEYFKTGYKSLSFQPDYEKYASKITFTSIAPRFNPPKVLSEKIGNLTGVADIEDKRTKKRIHYDVSLKRNLRIEDKDRLLSKIDSIVTTTLPCQTNITIRHSDGENVSFAQTNIPKILKKWLNWRIKLEEKVLNRLISIEREYLKKQKWILFAVQNRKEIIKALDSDDPKQYMIDELEMSEEQADFTLNLQLKRLAKLEEGGVKKKIKQHRKTIKDYKYKLENINETIIEQLKSD